MASDRFLTAGERVCGAIHIAKSAVGKGGRLNSLPTSLQAGIELTPQQWGYTKTKARGSVQAGSTRTGTREPPARARAFQGCDGGRTVGTRLGKKCQRQGLPAIDGS